MAEVAVEPKVAEDPAVVAAQQLFAASQRGDVTEVESALAEHAACASELNNAGRSALSLAAARGHLKVVKTLLDAGATDAACAGWTAVHHAAFGGHSEVLSALLAKHGAPAASRMPPLLLASNRGHVACVTLLLDAAPAMINEAVDSHGRTALMLAASGGSVAAVELLAQRGAALDAISVDGKSALMWAVSSHNPATVEALARLGADPTIAAPLSEVVVPGQDRSKGETADDLAKNRHAKDPTLRHVSTFLCEWTAVREATPGAPPPAMRPMPWVAHAHEFKAKEEAEAADAAAKAAQAADEPTIDELTTTGGAAAAADDNDIFGDVAADVSDAPAAPVGGSAAAATEAAAAASDASDKEAAEEAQRAVASADLDELD